MATATAIDVVMPQMGVSVSEGTISKWLKSEGEAVVADEPLLEISTDKVDTEVPSPANGVLSQVLVREGETVAVGTALAVIVPSSRAAVAEGALLVSLPRPVTHSADAEAGAASAETGPSARAGVERELAEDESGDAEGRTFVSPVVARIAAKHGIDVSRVLGTGRGRRVTKKDILQFLDLRQARPAPQERPPPAPPPPSSEAPSPTASGLAVPVSGEPAPGETFEPMSVMRRAIAEHMIRSTRTSAHVTTLFEVDMSKVVAIRTRLKQEYEASGVRLTLLAFIAHATVDTLRSWPRLNAEIRGDQIVTKSFVNLGIAVALDEGKGLIVPVIEHAEEKNLLGIARAIHDLADRARTKKLRADEVQAGTFTITSPGGFGSLAGTPIINQPQVGILDVEAIVKRPVVVTDEYGNDAIAIRPMMNLCLSYDHRLVDGAYAAPFMRDLKTSLETWDENAY